MAVKQLKEDKNYVPLLDDEFSRRRSSHECKRTLMKINYVPVLDDEFPEEEIHMAAKQIKQNKLRSCTI